MLTRALHLIKTTWKQPTTTSSDADRSDSDDDGDVYANDCEWETVNPIVPRYEWTPTSEEFAHAVLILHAYCVKDNRGSDDDTIFEADTVFTKMHPVSGWTITACIRSGNDLWIKDFVATHPKYGMVEGDFSIYITAPSKEAFDHFYQHHTPEKFELEHI